MGKTAGEWQTATGSNRARLPRPLTAAEAERYRDDGVVVLRQMFDRSWIETLNRGFDANLGNPTPRGRVWDRDADGKPAMLWDSQAWRGIDEYRQFVTESPAAEIAGRLMGAASATFYFDAVFSRSKGSQFKTPWHQDEPYWSVT